MRATVPITITNEAKDYVAELGMQEPFQRMLDHAAETIPGLQALDVTLEPPYDMEIPCVLIVAVKTFPGLDDPTQREWGDWRTSAFPPEVFQHFVLLVVYGTAHAR